MNHLSPLAFYLRPEFDRIRRVSVRVVNPGWVISLIALMLVFATSVAVAQGPKGSGQPIKASALAGTGFTYQGQLKQSGNPVDGVSCDFRFGLYDAQTGPTQIGTTQTTSAVVRSGYFTVSNLDFGSGAFDGNARWLDIQVRCPTGSGSYTALTTRQPLTPAPMALALPGLYTQQNSTSPNLIGGYSGNTVNGGVQGATIGGGGANGSLNRVTANYGVVGGGIGNAANGMFSTIGGGVLNSVSNMDSAVGGGGNNIASGASATIGGGEKNTASGIAAFIGGGGSDGSSADGNTAAATLATIGGGMGNNVTSGSDYGTISGGRYNTVNNNATFASVGGGRGNTASNTYATIGGGYSNNALVAAATVAGGESNAAGGDHAAIGGGKSNNASGDYATIDGGNTNIASGTNSSITGGKSNTASGANSTVAGGTLAHAAHYGEMAFASGSFGGLGDAQTSLYVLRNTTTDGSPTELFLDGSSQRITIDSGRTIAFDILIVGQSYSGLYEAGGFQLRGIVKNYAGSTTLVGSVTKDVFGRDNFMWDVSASADDVHDALQVRVTSSSGTVHWVASVRTVEVAF